MDEVRERIRHAREVLKAKFHAKTLGRKDEREPLMGVSENPARMSNRYRYSSSTYNTKGKQRHTMRMSQESFDNRSSFSSFSSFTSNSSYEPPSKTSGNPRHPSYGESEESDERKRLGKGSMFSSRFSRTSSFFGRFKRRNQARRSRGEDEDEQESYASYGGHGTTYTPVRTTYAEGPESKSGKGLFSAPLRVLSAMLSFKGGAKFEEHAPSFYDASSTPMNGKMIDLEDRSFEDSKAPVKKTPKAPVDFSVAPEFFQLETPASRKAKAQKKAEKLEKQESKPSLPLDLSVAPEFFQVKSSPSSSASKKGKSGSKHAFFDSEAQRASSMATVKTLPPAPKSMAPMPLGKPPPGMNGMNNMNMGPPPGMAPPPGSAPPRRRLLTTFVVDSQPVDTGRLPDV